MPRTYKDEVPLPDGFPFSAVHGLLHYVCESLSVQVSSVYLSMPDGTVSEDSWEAAVSQIEEGQTPSLVELKATRTDDSLSVRAQWWKASDGGVIAPFHVVTFTGPDQLIVLGAAQMFRRHLEGHGDRAWDEHFGVPTPVTQDETLSELAAAPSEEGPHQPLPHGTDLRAWLHNVSAATVAQVIGGGVLAVLAIIWAIVARG